MKDIARTSLAAALLLGAGFCVASETVPGILPSGFGDAVDRDVKTLREATAPFHALDRAVAAGYEQETECMENPPAGGMGYHFTKRELRDGVLELGKPEVLVYEKRADGSWKFNGVEYLVPIASWKQSEPPTIMGQKLKRFDKGGFYYLHVWSWKPSSSGIFADWNPDVKCKEPPK